MTDHVDAGANIIRAMQVVRSTHREVARMIAALDELLLARAWEPLAGQSWLDLTMQGAQLGNPGNWLAGTLHRAYVPFAAADESKDAARRAIAVYEIQLEPPGALEPLVTAARALLQPTTPRKLWDGYKWGPPVPWRRVTTPGRFEIDASELTAILPVVTPQSVVVYVEALATIDRTNLGARLVEPVFRSPA